MRCQSTRHTRHWVNHEVTLQPDWTISTPHDLQAERIAVALGGWLSCLELEQSVKAAKHGMLLKMRRKWYPLRRRGASDWIIRDKGSVRRGGFPSVITAAAYARSPQHLANRFGAVEWQTARLLTVMACRFEAFAAPPIDCVQSRELVEEPDGLETLWDAGIHPLKIPALADRIGVVSRALPARHYIEIAYSGLGLGTSMSDAGELAEAARWLIESAESFDVQLSEDIYLNLYLMALKGFFAGTRDTHPEEIIAGAWARAYPATWGLVPRMIAATLDIEHTGSEIPAPQAVADCATDWLSRMLPVDGTDQIHSGGAVSSVFTVRGTSIEAAYGSDRPAVLELSTTTCEDPATEWTLTMPPSPRSKLAGVALLLALSQLTGDEADYVEVPEPFDPDTDTAAVLADHVDVGAIGRLVLVDRQG